MTTKAKTSKAKLSAVPAAKAGEKTVEEAFEEFKKGELFKIDSVLAQDTRADTWIGVANGYKSLHGVETLPGVGAVQAVVDKVVEAHEEVKRRIEAWEAGDFGVEPADFKDPYEDMLVHGKRYADWSDVFEDYMVFSAVRPFGENAQRINDAMLAKRGSVDAA